MLLSLQVKIQVEKTWPPSRYVPGTRWGWEERGKGVLVNFWGGGGGDPALSADLDSTAAKLLGLGGTTRDDR